ncbi:DUF1403 family protein [Methylocapsa acidiphila]|uniref:DUF1403 family protein n=1 Tax=Methylocapsa acidiphila TaxID=133552 RepID=UPI00040E9F37|nr:DUF1403 family protein [Methylocapsa acidiphila]
MPFGHDASLDAAFSAGAGLALFDAALATRPHISGVLRQRLALRAGVACAAMMRMREDERALRDAQHFIKAGADPGPAGRLHRLWRLFAARRARIDGKALRAAADLLGLDAPASIQSVDLDRLVAALDSVAKDHPNPIVAAALSGSATLQALPNAARGEAEILALWVADLALANRLGWDRPVPLIAASILHPSLRAKSSRKRPQPDDQDWLSSCAKAYARASAEAYDLASDLARRSAKLRLAALSLRAKGAGRAVELLLTDDVVAPAMAAMAAGLSDRASRRLFDRLIELGAVRELSGRPSFRLYGL